MDSKIRESKNIILLLAIGIALSVFYLLIIKNYSIYNIPHYEFYTRALLLYKSIMMGRWDSFIIFFGNYIGNEITNFRSIPLMLVFGPSQFVYKYSSFLLNYFLFIMLYLSLEKVFQKKKAIFITLCLLFSYFTIELLASPYTDLTFFLACTIFFIHLKRFSEDRTKSNLPLVLSVFLMFFSRSLSYVVLPVFSLFILGYYLTKKERIAYCLRYSILVTFGFLIFFGVVYGFSLSSLTKEMSLPTMLMFNTGRQTDFLVMAQKMLSEVNTRGISNNRLIFGKFYNPESPEFTTLTLSLMYISQFYLLLRRERFWFFLFIVSEISLLTIFNLLSIGYDIRFALPFYFLYLYPSFDMAFELLSRFSAKDYMYAAVIVVLAASSFIVFFERLPAKLVYSHNDAYYTEYIHNRIFSKLPLGSRVYIKEDFSPEKRVTYGAIIRHTPEKYFREFGLEKTDPRYRVSIMDEIATADYVICSICTDTAGFVLSESLDPGIPIYVYQRIK